MQQVIELQDLRRSIDRFAQKAKAGESFVVVVVEQTQPLFRIEPVKEIWEDVIDFAEIDPKGIAAEEVLARL
ncbi:hypothetical protein A3J43_03215 [Candidatus Uhrbacteria bacterium RIFCSPHIGHO2_12_FULL_54_23]|uniref:Prevent-host-death protein n=1 Tax=Candidatus Uhrbacteria bacterium RIFCSPHIGHO2_12_FULL_54_23 TaxID=1802397 RepID=A0A1F7UIY3_9BACT|nr:MAG: hypothetical protein A3J43_03215 [Candidatus Uhrbacteria bacterium RIFCSPHIGHO2_12_FULL_54_23]